MQVTLTDMTDTATWSIWQAGAKDEGWLLPTRDRAEFERMIEGFLAARVLGRGDIQAAAMDGRYVGYVTFSVIGDEWLPPAIGTAVECGTYLIPSARGIGLNCEVKMRTIEHAATAFRAQQCVFVIANRNVRAKRAFMKLPIPIVHHTADGGDFSKYGKRKAWETGEPCCVYSVYTDDVLTTLAVSAIFRESEPSQAPS